MKFDKDIGITEKCKQCNHLIAQHKRWGCLYVGCDCKIFEIDLHKMDDKELEKWR